MNRSALLASLLLTASFAPASAHGLRFAVPEIIKHNKVATGLVLGTVAFTLYSKKYGCPFAKVSCLSSIFSSKSTKANTKVKESNQEERVSTLEVENNKQKEQILILNKQKEQIVLLKVCFAMVKETLSANGIELIDEKDLKVNPDLNRIFPNNNQAVTHDGSETN